MDNTGTGETGGAGWFRQIKLRSFPESGEPEFAMSIDAGLFKAAMGNMAHMKGFLPYFKKKFRVVLEYDPEKPAVEIKLFTEK